MKKDLCKLNNVSNYDSVISFLNNLDRCLVDEKLKEKLVCYIKSNLKDDSIVYEDMIKIGDSSFDDFCLEIIIRNSDFKFGNTSISYKAKKKGSYSFDECGSYELYENGSYVHEYDLIEERKGKDLYKSSLFKSEYYDSFGVQVFDEIYRTSSDWILKQKRTCDFKSISFRNSINEVFKRLESSVCFEGFGYGKESRKYSDVKYLKASDVNCFRIEEIKEDNLLEINKNKFRNEIGNCYLGRANVRQKYENF